MDEKSKKCPPIRVTRVTLPRYEVEYAVEDTALEHAEAIKASRILQLAYDFGERIGQEVVLDFGVVDTTSKATLLFRIIQRFEDLTILEWWPRRKTDPDLLDLWIEVLGRARRADAEELEIPTEEIQRIYELGRRALSANPFVALDVHWTCDGQLAEQACRKALDSLTRFENAKGLPPRLSQLLEKAKVGLREARQSLAKLEDRKWARKKFVPRDQLISARQLVKTRLGVSKLRGDETGYAEAMREKRELDF